MTDLKALVDQAALDSGQARMPLLKTGPVSRAALLLRNQTSKSPAWSAADDEFLRVNLTKFSDADLARLLGRTEIAVHLRWKRELDIPARSKQPDLISANQIAEGLAVDVHAVCHWVRLGLLTAQRLPGITEMLMIRRVTLLRFVVNWRNWIYFEPRRINRGSHRSKYKYDQDFWDHVRRLALRARRAWKDAWWTPGQVAAYHGVCLAVVNNAVHDGRLPNAVKWGNWRILRSVAKACTRLHTGRGSNMYRDYSPKFDRFIILGTALGLSNSTLAAFSNCTAPEVAYRREQLFVTRQVPDLARSLGVEYNVRTRSLFVDWRQHRRKFPAVTLALRKFKTAPSTLSRLEIVYVRGVLLAWARRWYHRSDRQVQLKRLTLPGLGGWQQLLAIYQKLRAVGIDPLRGVACLVKK
ncbi:MAG: hypothetical protein IPO08_23650 [Xanthomonadales bacterium]|nr:hypothetical protein [Xanthomonadales bacterium]